MIVSTVEEYIDLFKKGYRLSTLEISKEIQKLLFNYVNLHKDEDEDYMYLYGYCYGRGYGVLENHKTAFNIYLKLTEKQNSRAQCKIGWCYENGQGVTTNYVEAVKWYRIAALKEDARAQCNLAWCYKTGRGVEQDIFKAVEWYKKSASHGQYMAQWNLGWLYEQGYGVKQDYLQAIKLYKASASQDHELSQLRLGQLYENGLGVKKDYQEAAKWYEKAAEHNFAKAQYSLGCLYENGLGVTKDLKKAKELYEASAIQKYARAQYSLGCLYENGQGVTKNIFEAIKWYEMSAEQKFAKAQLKLGQIYEKGIGVFKNLIKAKELYEEALIQGSVEAKTLLENIKKIISKERLHCSDCKDVFISWNHKDKRIKDEIVNYLENDSGFFTAFSLWESDNDGKGDLDECIKNAIDDAHSYIIILTGNAIRSPWVKKEVDYILKKAESTQPVDKLKDESYKICIKIILINRRTNDDGSECFCDVQKEIEESKDEVYSKLLEYAWIFDKYDLKKLSKSLTDAIKWSLLLEYKHRLVKKYNTFPTALTSVVESQVSASGLIPFSLKFDDGYLERQVFYKDEAYSLEKLLILNNHFLIYGEGGIGKTLYLQHLIISHFNKNNFLFYITSENINNFEWENYDNLADETFLTFLKVKCFDCVFDSIDAKKIEVVSFNRMLNNQNSIYFLVDGLDEINTNIKEMFLRKVNQFLSTYSNTERLHFIFSSRSIMDLALISKYITEKEIIPCELKGISNEEIEKIYENMTKNFQIEKSNSKLDSQLFIDYNKKTFIARLSGISADVKNNPLLLTNLIFIFLTTKEILTKKYNVIDKSISILIKDLERERNVKFEYQEYIQGERLYKVLGYVSVSQAYGNTQNIEKLLEGYLSSQKNCSEIALSISEYLHRRTIFVGNHISHKIFNNFFAAKYIFDEVYEYQYNSPKVLLQFCAGGKRKLRHYIEDGFSKNDETWINITCDFILKIDNEINTLSNDDKNKFLIFKYTLRKMIWNKKISSEALEVIWEMSGKDIFYYNNMVQKNFKYKERIESKKKYKRRKIKVS